VEFSVSRDGNLTVPLTVQLETPTGTATDGVDYQSIDQSVTIDAGQTSKLVEVPIIDDPVAEGPETIKLSIKPAADNSYVLGPFSQTTLTTHDNPSVNSVSVDVVPPGPGQTQSNNAAGFNFFANITVKGEALDRTSLEMQVQST